MKDKNMPDFTVLYKRYKDIAYNEALKVTKNRCSAEDAVQDAFFKASSNMDKILNEEHFVRWLIVATRRSAIDIVRKIKRYSFMEDFKPWCYHLRTNQHLPEASLLRKEVRKTLLSMVRSLPSPSCLIISRKFYHDLSYSEISEFSGVKENTLRSQCHRALKALQEKYGEQILELKQTLGEADLGTYHKPPGML